MAKCECASCRQLALSGKYICNSCAEVYPHDGVRWVKAGPRSIRVYVQDIDKVEICPLNTKAVFVTQYADCKHKARKWWKQAWAKVKGACK